MGVWITYVFDFTAGGDVAISLEFGRYLKYKGLEKSNESENNASELPERLKATRVFGWS